MRKLKTYMGMMLVAVAASAGFTSCQDDMDAPDINVPKATLTPNTTIAQVKQQYWDDADNYINTIEVAEGQEHVVISGRVISSDAAGNIYKSLVIQDATGALAMSVNANSLYNDFRIGQEVVIDLTDMYIGKYSTLQQLGYPDYSESYGWQATFMPLEFFKKHVQLNGLPEPAAVDTLTLNLGDLSNGADALRKYQSQLVRFNNVYFEDGGEKSFCDAHKVNTNRNLKDDNGNTIIVRTSGYANYWSLKLPEEHGDVVGILSTYKSGSNTVWQLLMRSPSDLLNFGDPTLPKGTETNPYDVIDAIGMINGDKPVSAWYTGYIVGSVKAGIQEVASADDIVWGAAAEMNNTLIVGQTAESVSLDDCLLIRLPQGSALRQYGNLRDNPDVYGRQIWLLGTPGTDMGTSALTGNTGTSGEFRIEGVTVPGGDTPVPGDGIPVGDGSEASPYNPTQVVGFGTSADMANQWVSGYIVGWVDNANQNFADANNCMFTVPATVATNVLLATTPDVTDYSKCCVVNLPNTNGIRAAVNLVDNPGNKGKVLSVYGTIKKYFAIPGVRDLTAYKLDGEGGGDTPDPDVAVTTLNETFEGGTTIPSGWKSVEQQGNASWFIRTYNSNNSAEITAFGSTKTPGATGFTSWLISPALNVDGMTSKTLSFKSMVGYTGNGTLEVFAMTSADPSTATLTKLNANIPAATGTWSDWVESGNLSLSGFTGTIYIGFRYNAPTGANYTTYRVDDVVAGTGSTGGGETPNPPVTEAGSADLNTLNTKTSYTGSVTTTDGWVLTNCAVQGGSDDPSAQANPNFGYIGGAEVRAAVLNGKVGACGNVVSPTLSGGIKTLSLKYGFSFGDSKCKFTVNIKQNGAVVQSKTETIDSLTKFTVYDFTMDVNVTGDFVIEIVNDAYSESSSNKDRVSIWNISWTR